MIIYKPKGPALEYAPYAANLYRGCSHGCVYCYAPKATFTDKEKFHSPEFVSVRKNVERQFKNDCRKFKNEQNILLSFTTDPYQPIEEEGLTRWALNEMKTAGLSATVLTKGGEVAQHDIDILSQMQNPEFAVTLTTDSKSESKQWEPGAALPEQRIENLKEAKKAGIRTWVSFEPVFNTEAVYRLVEKTYEFVDFYKIGKMNYHPIAKKINWHNFAREMIRLMEKYNKSYMIKRDLKKFIV